MVSSYLLRDRTPKEIRAAMARLAQQKKAAPAECWEECDDPFCPYTHTPTAPESGK